jgi:hypothetical protein
MRSSTGPGCRLKPCYVESISRSHTHPTTVMPLAKRDARAQSCRGLGCPQLQIALPRAAKRRDAPGWRLSLTPAARAEASRSTRRPSLTSYEYRPARLPASVFRRAAKRGCKGAALPGSGCPRLQIAMPRAAKRHDAPRWHPSVTSAATSTLVTSPVSQTTPFPHILQRRARAVRAACIQ